MTNLLLLLMLIKDSVTDLQFLYSDKGMELRHFVMFDGNHVSPFWDIQGRIGSPENVLLKLERQPPFITIHHVTPIMESHFPRLILFSYLEDKIFLAIPTLILLFPIYT